MSLILARRKRRRYLKKRGTNNYLKPVEKAISKRSNSSWRRKPIHFSKRMGGIRYYGLLATEMKRLSEYSLQEMLIFHTCPNKRNSSWRLLRSPLRPKRITIHSKNLRMPEKRVSIRRYIGPATRDISNLSGSYLRLG